jgi:hypothetical protein
VNLLVSVNRQDLSHPPRVFHVLEVSELAFCEIVNGAQTIKLGYHSDYLNWRNYV